MLTIITTNLLRRKARTVFTASGIAVGVATIVALLSFTQGLKETAASFVHLGGADLVFCQPTVPAPPASVLPESILARLKARPEVARATPLVLLVEGIHSDPAAIVFGAEPGGFFSRGLVLLEGGRPPPGASAALVGDRLAARAHLHVGSRLAISGSANLLPTCR